MDTTWESFKLLINELNDDYRAFIYRGQANSEWKLSTTIHRTGQILSHNDLVVYFESILPFVQEAVEAWDGSRRDLTNEYHLAEFLSFLQHNGFPTPLIDWTFSPYIAAYFAFEGINHFQPQYDKVAIYAFNQKEWMKHYKQIYDYKIETDHVTVLNPTYRGNHKQMFQQGTFLYTNINDIEKHITINEESDNQFMTKYEISVKERKTVFKDLSAMNITAMHLAPSIESVCKKAYEELCTRLDMGLSPQEFKNVVESMMADNLQNVVDVKVEDDDIESIDSK